MSKVYIKAVENITLEGEKGYVKSVRNTEGGYMYSLTDDKVLAIDYISADQAMCYIDLIAENGLKNNIVFIIE